MRNHLYFNSTNLDYIKFLRDDYLFEIVSEYPEHEANACHRNEWGRIKTANNYIHLIMGKVPDIGCPWCGSPAASRKIKDATIITPSQYCMECLICGARGPILNVIKEVELDPRAMEEIKDLMYQRYSYRNGWDARTEWKKEFKDL